MKRRLDRFAPHSKGSLHPGVGVHLRGRLSAACIASELLVLLLLQLPGLVHVTRARIIEGEGSRVWGNGITA